MKRATVETDRFEPQRVLLSQLFTASLAILVLNDFYLKYQFSNFVTGKLSDVAGLFAFPLFFSAFLPSRRFAIYVSTGLAFSLWKTPLADGMIEFWNSQSFLQIGRTIDYGDLFALTVLPLSYIYFRVARQIELPSFMLRRAATVATVLFSVFAFTATSGVGDRGVNIGDSYSIGVAYTELEIEPILRKNPRIISVKSTVVLDDSHEDLQTETSENTISNRRRRARRSPQPSPTLPPMYFFTVEISVKTCNSETSRFSFIAERNNNTLQIKSVNLSFNCPQYHKADDQNVNALDKTYIEHGRQIFEEHVINYLTQHRPE